MNVLEHVNYLLNSNGGYDVNMIDNLLLKYKLSFPLKYDDIFLIDDKDLKELLFIFEGENSTNIYEALMGNYTVINMFKSNPNNLFFKDRYDNAVIFINNLVLNLNALYKKYEDIDTNLINKYKGLITNDEIKESIVNFDELDQVLHYLKLSIKEIGDIKKEIGKANIKFAKLNNDISLEDEDLFIKVEKILNKEKKLINDVSKEELEKFVNEGISENNKQLDVVSVLTLLFSEYNHAKNNLSNEIEYNKSVKLLRDYVLVYDNLKLNN